MAVFHMPIKLGDNLILYDAKELAEQFHTTPLTIKTTLKAEDLRGRKWARGGMSLRPALMSF
jgi:hypothetical protein